MTIYIQLLWLFILAIPIACITWTITKEEVFKEPREYCTDKCKTGKTLLKRKFFYLFTCEYCFSHYVRSSIKKFEIWLVDSTPEKSIQFLSGCFCIRKAMFQNVLLNGWLIQYHPIQSEFFDCLKKIIAFNRFYDITVCTKSVTFFYVRIFFR